MNWPIQCCRLKIKPFNRRIRRRFHNSFSASVGLCLFSWAIGFNFSHNSELVRHLLSCIIGLSDDILHSYYLLSLFLSTERENMREKSLSTPFFSERPYFCCFCIFAQ